MSAEIFRIELVPGGRKNKKYTSNNIRIEANKFKKYVNPGSWYFWNDQCTDIHGLHPNHKSIVSAYLMAIVWRQFEEWTQSNIGRDKTAILVIYNVNKCDLLWVWKLTQASHSPFSCLGISNTS